MCQSFVNPEEGTPQQQSDVEVGLPLKHNSVDRKIQVLQE